MSKYSDSRRRIAFTGIGGSKWIAGGRYLQNMLSALNTLDGNVKPERIIVEPPNSAKNKRVVKQFAEKVLIWPQYQNEHPYWGWVTNRLLKSYGLWIGARPSLSRLLRDNYVDCVFATTHFGPGFRPPLIAWIPDFQHRYLPTMFSSEMVKQRDKTYGEMAKHACRIVVSSKVAISDIHKLFPTEAHKAEVLSFVVDIPQEIYETDPSWVCHKYSLPERFVLVPNQFWKHKNHELALEALDLVKSKGDEVTVVCTGSTYDYRDPLAFGKLLAEISRRGLREHFIILGYVPNQDLLALMRQSVAILQPSIYEGWNTGVEEAKSLGKSVLLSDIPVHREQDPPQAHFFSPDEPQGLADILSLVGENCDAGPDSKLEQEAMKNLLERRKAYAENIMRIIDGAVGECG